jgi:hypothetical protein
MTGSTSSNMSGKQFEKDQQTSKRTKCFTILNILAFIGCAAGLTVQIIYILGHLHKQSTYFDVKETVHESLEMPSITICSVQGYRNKTFPLTMDEFKNSTYGLDDFFHPTSKSLESQGCTIKETPTQRHGMCYTIEKKELVTKRYSFIVMNFNMDWDIDIYLHEKGDELWIALGSTPSELALNHDTIDASNEDGMRAASIKATKIYVEKLPKKGMDCQKGVTSIQYRDCAVDRIRSKFADSGECTTGPLMYYGIGNQVCNDTQIYTFLVNYVKVMDEVVEGQMCGRRCEVNSYPSRKMYVHDKKLNWGDSTMVTEYFKVGIYLDSFVVEEKVEYHIYEMDSAVAAIGGSLGLFLGYSCYSVVTNLIEGMLKSKDKKTVYVRKGSLTP